MIVPASQQAAINTKTKFLMADALSVGADIVVTQGQCNPTMFARLQLLPVSWGSIVMRFNVGAR